MNRTLFGRTPLRGGRPEPLYTLTEVADRMGMSMPRLRSHMQLSPIPAPKHRLETERGKLFAMSDFRRWWKELHTADARVGQLQGQGGIINPQTA